MRPNISSYSYYRHQRLLAISGFPPGFIKLLDFLLGISFSLNFYLFNFLNYIQDSLPILARQDSLTRWKHVARWGLHKEVLLPLGILCSPRLGLLLHLLTPLPHHLCMVNHSMLQLNLQLYPDHAFLVFPKRFIKLVTELLSVNVDPKARL